MSRSVTDIEHDIDALSVADKSRVLRHLVADMDRGNEPQLSADELEAEWVALAEQRMRELENGTVRPIPLEDVMRRLRGRLATDG